MKIKNFKNYIYDINITKLKILNFLIFCIWLLFIYYEVITLSRLITFFIILFLIIIYRFLIDRFQNIKINNLLLLKILIYFNKYRNPIIILILIFEEYVFNILCKYPYKLLVYIFYLIFLFIINPIKIIFYKIYKILFLWRINKYYKIIINRMLGLILSVLIFTNILNFIQWFLGINIWILIYIYLLIVSFLSQIYDKHISDSFFFKLFLEVPFSLYNLISIRLNNNLISLILDYNNINEKNYYFNFKNLYKIEKNTLYNNFEALNNTKLYKDKPSYWLYNNLGYILEHYFDALYSYIYLNLKNWDLSDIKKLNFEPLDNKKIKILYNYDFKLIKIILFLIFDLENYLGRNIKDILKLDNHYNGIIINYFEFNLDKKEFFEVIKTKEPFIIFNEEILIKLNYFLFYKDIYKDSYKDKKFISYKKLYDMLPYTDLTELKEIKNFEDSEYIIWYKNFINEIHTEWSLIEDRKVWYTESLKDLEKDLQKIVELADY